MSPLFRAELLRFRAWALAAGVLHLGILGLLSRVVDLGQQPLLVYRLFAAAYGLTGLLLGLYQMGNTRRANTWLQLLHRPLAPWRIALSLGGACAVLLVAAIGLPILVTALGQHGLTARVVDGRHLLLALAATLIAVSGYLAGAYALLGGKWHALLALALLAWPWVSQAGGLGALAVQLLTLGWLATLVVLAFRPARGETPRRGLALAVVALPVVFGVWAAFRPVAMGIDLVWILFGTHPLNSAAAPGGYLEALRSEPDALFQAGLAGARHDEARLWQEQVKISKIHDLEEQFGSWPRRGELTNPVPLEFDDDARRVRWAFSHDTGLFQGIGLTDGRAAGTLGIGVEGTPFVEPAVPLGDSFVATARTLYEYDSEHQRLWPRLSVPAGEELRGALLEPVGDHVVLLSDRSLLFFKARELATGNGPLEPRFALPLPAPGSGLTHVDLVELLDGYLVSFLYGRTVLFGKGDAFQEIVRASTEGTAERVARRPLTPDGPAVWRYQRWWPAPVVSALADRAERLFAPAAAAEASLAPRPVGLLWTAAGVLALSLGVAIWRLRTLPLSTAQRLGWLVACLVLGLPALITLGLLYPGPWFAARRPHRQPQGSPLPA